MTGDGRTPPRRRRPWAGAPAPITFLAVQFQISQAFAAPLDVLLAALWDPSYLATMGELADLGAPVIESQEPTPGRVRQRVRFEFTGKLPGAVSRVVDPRRLSWVEHTEIDLSAARASFRMQPVHYQKLFSCQGSWVLRRDGDDRTTRDIRGDLRVSSPVPFTGGPVEKAIVSGLRDRLAHEPAVFARWRAQGR